jgi:hypothetical protein
MTQERLGAKGDHEDADDGIPTPRPADMGHLRRRTRHETLHGITRTDVHMLRSGRFADAGGL